MGHQQAVMPRWSSRLQWYLCLMLAALTIMAAGLIYFIFREQETIRQIGRYNVTWVVSQAAHETLRLQEVVGAYASPSDVVELENIELRLQILENRMAILRRGEVGNFIKLNTEFMETVAALAALLPRIEERLTNKVDGVVATELRRELEPFVPKMLAIAAAANTWTGDRVAEDQKRLSQLHWSLTILLFLLIICMSLGVCSILKWSRNFIETLYLAKVEAEEADKAKTNFLAQMSHELRTPLNAVIGFSEMIEMGLAGPPGGVKYLEYVSGIKKSGQHLLGLVNDLLDLARLRSGASDMELGLIDVRGCLLKSIDLVKPKYLEKNMEIVVTPMPERWLAIADHRSIQQIFINLLFNSIKFSPPGSVINVSAQEGDDDKKLRISIQDQGPGLSEAILSQIGKPFIDRGSTMIANAEGTGLGLAIVVQLVRTMNGEFRIVNEPEGGARAEIVLASQNAAAALEGSASVGADRLEAKFQPQRRHG